MPKVRKAELSFLYATCCLVPVLHFCQVPSKYSKGYSSYKADTKSFSNKTKGDNSKSKKASVANLVCDRSSRPDLHFYQVSSKYSKGYSSYRADKKFYADANGIHMSPPPTPTYFGGVEWGMGEHTKTNKKKQKKKNDIMVWSGAVL